MSTEWQVYKFGGSSLGVEGRLQKSLALIASGPRPLAVVVSALGDTTDWLVLAARSAENGELEKAMREVERVREQAVSAAARVLDDPTFEEFAKELEALLAPVGRVLAGIELTRECSARTLDLVIGAGEQISAALVGGALRDSGVPAKVIDAREFIVTDASHGNGVVDWDATCAAFGNRAAEWEPTVPVVTGFIGRTADGHPTTLGRNGSDYTATIVARLLGAGTVTVWTDVVGVMTADPALVHEAAPVDRLSYDEALELAYFGTRMIHTRTIIPLRESGGVMWIRSSADPSRPGTRIDAHGNSDPNRPTCVTSLERLTMIGLESRRTGIGRPIGGRIVTALEHDGIRVWMSSESTLGQTFAVIVPSQDAEETLRVIRETVAAEIESGDLGIGTMLTPVSLVTLVAEAMGAGPNVAGRFYSSIGRCGINVHAVAMGATSRSISCVVDGDKTAQTVRAVHSAFNLAHTEMNILLLGKGVVGGSLLRQIKDHGAALERDHQVSLRVVGVGGSAGAFYDSEGIDPSQAEARLKQAVAQGTAARDISRLLEPFSRLPNPVLVDCTGADGMEEIYAEAFTRGVSVVASNKKPLALPLARYEALHSAARRHFRAFAYETTVGAALPVIETLKNLVRTGDTVLRIEGSLSGSLGFICAQMARGMSISKAVREARELGYTEPHPRDDLAGTDVARKALILARELGVRAELADVKVEPLIPAALLAEDDIEKFLSGIDSLDKSFAKREEELRAKGQTLRYLARIVPGDGGISISAAPFGVEADHPAGSLKGAEAFVAFYTERYSEYPLVVRGAGAGGVITASGVLADILLVAQGLRSRR